MEKAYDPKEVEGRWYPFWLSRGYFKAEAQSSKLPFCIVLLGIAYSLLRALQQDERAGASTDR